jgi:hypothetical protein
MHKKTDKSSAQFFDPTPPVYLSGLAMWSFASPDASLPTAQELLEPRTPPQLVVGNIDRD